MKDADRREPDQLRIRQMLDDVEAVTKGWFPDPQEYNEHLFIGVGSRLRLPLEPSWQEETAR